MTDEPEDTFVGSERRRVTSIPVPPTGADVTAAERERALGDIVVTIEHNFKAIAQELADIRLQAQFEHREMLAMIDNMRSSILEAFREELDRLARVALKLPTDPPPSSHE